MDIKSIYLWWNDSNGIDGPNENTYLKKILRNFIVLFFIHNSIIPSIWSKNQFTMKNLLIFNNDGRFLSFDARKHFDAYFFLYIFPISCVSILYTEWSLVIHFICLLFFYQFASVVVCVWGECAFSHHLLLILLLQWSAINWSVLYT